MAATRSSTTPSYCWKNSVARYSSLATWWPTSLAAPGNCGSATEPGLIEEHVDTKREARTETGEDSTKNTSVSFETTQQWQRLFLQAPPLFVCDQRGRAALPR